MARKALGCNTRVFAVMRAHGQSAQALENVSAVFRCMCVGFKPLFLPKSPLPDRFVYDALLRTKKRAHETLFGGEACSSAHCTLLLSAT